MYSRSLACRSLSSVYYLLLVGSLFSIGGCSHFVSGPDRATLLAPRQHGLASFYGDEFVGKQTASGEIYRHEALTAAHPALPFGTLVRVTNELNKATVIVRINDRGPFAEGRIIDLSKGAAQALDMVHRGVAEVAVEKIPVKLEN